MMRCPQCNHIATDNLLAFCRTDGARLVQDSDSLSDSKTVALLPDAPAAPPSVMDESLNARAASTRLMDSPKATSPTINLIGRKKLKIGVTVIAALIVLTLAGAAYYSLSRKSDA